MHSQCYEFSEGSAMNAFTIPAQSCLLQAEKPRSPQLAYYYRAMAAGKHPRKLRSLGLPVVPRVATNADQARSPNGQFAAGKAKTLHSTN